MEKQASRRARDMPSFSSSLLDAIYRSLDDDDPNANRDPITRQPPHHPVHHPIPTKHNPTCSIGNPTVPVIRPRPYRIIKSSSSSSDMSSSAGFSSSSEPESGSARLRPIRTCGFRSGPAKTRPVSPPPDKKKTGSVKNRATDPTRPKTPASPGSRLAGFIGSLFSSSATKNSKKPAPVSRAAGEDSASACSSAASFSRLGLSVTPSSKVASDGVKRSVRFCHDGVYAAVGKVAPRKAETKQGVRGDKDGDDVASDGSSDLFELEDLTVVAGCYKDELPVYGTTSLGGSRVISHGLML